jgi:hypothetical protein
MEDTDIRLSSRLRGNDRTDAAERYQGSGVGNMGLIHQAPTRILFACTNRLIGACRGAEPLCVSYHPPRVGVWGLTLLSPGKEGHHGGR